MQLGIQFVGTFVGLPNIYIAGAGGFGENDIFQDPIVLQTSFQKHQVVIFKSPEKSRKVAAGYILVIEDELSSIPFRGKQKIVRVRKRTFFYWKENRDYFRGIHTREGIAIDRGGAIGLVVIWCRKNGHEVNPMSRAVHNSLD